MLYVEFWNIGNFEWALIPAKVPENRMSASSPKDKLSLQPTNGQNDLYLA